MRFVLLLAGAALFSQEPAPVVLSLTEAEALAVRTHPRIASARLGAAAAREAPRQAKAALSPVVIGNVTGSVADTGTRLGAGQLNASSLFTRSATGLNINQLVWDFGRTRALTGSLEDRAAAAEESMGAIRAEVILRVREAFFRLLLAQTQVRVLNQNLENRRLTLKQVSALTQSELRSTLDLSFAELNAAEAELAVTRAGNEVRSAEVQLAAAIGYAAPSRFTVREEADPEPLPVDPEQLVGEALQSRRELTSLRLQARAAQRFAESERRQALPALSAIGVAGVYGPSNPILRPRYGAVGMNLSIPVLNGGSLASRRREAELRADAIQQDLRDLEVRLAREVRMAWIEADNASKSLPLTGKVLEQANRALRLAQTRYRLGLSNIVELSQAQLSQVTAEVGAASARLEYLLRRSVLDFQMGRL